MKLGYAMFPQASVAGETAALDDAARMARELALVDVAGGLGFDDLWVTEHHFGDYNLAPAPLQVLAYVAGRFPSLTLGTMVIVLPWNDPLRVVEGVVLLDHLCGGRLLVGFGKGEAQREFRAFGMDVAEGRRRFDADLGLVLRALETGVLERPGEEPVRVRPTPARSFAGRLYMAAGSPDSIDRAAREGLGLLRIALRSWDEVAEQVARHRAEHRAARGGAEPPPVVSLTFGYCDRDPVRARELGTEYARAYRMSAIHHYGLPDGEAELQRFAEAQVWGTPTECVEKARAIAAATGTERLAVAFRYAGVPYDRAEASMRLFAAEVAPHLQEAVRV
jgi:alkanesulfonate monooxygenase SsuD/methylene tetrahydromethanopterin reductase-like flavin-dependent oxidoreductase (luciferase family)